MSYPRSKKHRTPAQQEAIATIAARGKFKTEAVAFYEALLGLPLNAPGPKKDRDGRIVRDENGQPRLRGKRYRKCREFAAEAIRCAETGEKPNRRTFGRYAIFQRYQQLLERASVISLTGMAARSKTILGPAPVEKPAARNAAKKPNAKPAKKTAPLHEPLSREAAIGGLSTMSLEELEAATSDVFYEDYWNDPEWLAALAAEIASLKGPAPAPPAPSEPASEPYRPTRFDRQGNPIVVPSVPDGPTDDPDWL